MKRQRTGELDYQKGKGFTSWLGLSTCFLLLLSAGQAYADLEPVWKWDMRQTFFDIEYLNKEEAVIVGDRGRVLVTHNRFRNLWSPRESGTRELLTCLSFVDEELGWAAGHGGIIIHTRDGGNTWKTLRPSSPDNLPLFDIHFPSPDVGYACGPYDTLLKTSDGGKTWTELSTGLDNIYNSLTFLDKDTGFLVGEFGSVLKTVDGGQSWEKLDIGTYEGTFFGITLLSPQIILVHGISGAIMRSEDGGASWKDISADTEFSLFRSAVGGNEVAMVGPTGTILISTDGGKTFQDKTDKDHFSFAGVAAHPDGGFICVGAFGKIYRVPGSGNKQKED